jgi:hypothetical protein
MAVPDFDRRIERIETKLSLMLSLLHAGRLLCALGAAGGDVGEARRMT